MEPFENPWMKKIRLLTKLLLVSIAANIGFGTALLYKVGGRKEDKIKAVVLEESNGEVLASYFKKNFTELARALRDKTLLQDGYAKRDLALACLVNYHYLNLDRAISGKPIQRRKLTFIHQEGGEGFHVEVFPGLDDLDFAMVEKFIKEEKWPLSAEGLFIELKKEREPSLESAFLATPEFYLLYTSLKRLDEHLAREKVLQFLLSGGWEEIQNWIGKLKSGIDPMEAMREGFQEYVRKGGSEVATLWIALDSEFIQRKLTDLELHRLMQQVKDNVLATNIFLKQILCSVRSDEVRKEAAIKLYAFSGMLPPEPYDHEHALQTFIPSMFAKKVVPVSYTAPVVKKYKVAEGDSLWKISKQHKVSIEALREANNLKHDQLKPGQELVIP